MIDNCRRGAEIGPASPTGLPAKYDQAKSITKGIVDVILYRQRLKVPKRGSYVEYVRLPLDKAKELMELAKVKGWTAEQIWEAAGKRGTVLRTRVSAQAAAQALNVWRRGKQILTGVKSVGTKARCTMGFGPIDFIIDGATYIYDPHEWERRANEEGMIIFPGMIILPGKTGGGFFYPGNPILDQQA